MSEYFDVDYDKFVLSDESEFSNSSKSGFDLYVQKCKDQSFASDFVSDVTLSGHSSDGKISCGETKIIGCLEKDLHGSNQVHMKRVTFHCNSKGCNVCFESTIKREARAITNRMMTFCNLKKNRQIYLKEQNRIRILSHVTVSVPHDKHDLVLTKEGRKELRKQQIKILKRLDVDGGVSIFHPYRFTEGLESAFVSPHFHNIVTGWIDGSIVKSIYEETGWIVKQISTMETVNDCYNLAKYLLSHAGVFEKGFGKRSSEHSVSYFGECQNRFFKVEELLKNSLTGYDELDQILYSRKYITKKDVTYDLQSVGYTFSTINDSVKDSTNVYFESNGDMQSLTKSLRRYITPQRDRCIDNPALSQSATENKPLEFLQMRLDYGDSKYSIVQSVYLNIVFDPSLDELCPECSLKMQTLSPPEQWSVDLQNQFKEIFKYIPEDTTISLDNSLGLDYLANVKISVLGMPYFKNDGMLDHETGIYSRPSCLDKMNSKLYWNVIKNTELQKFKYVFRVEHGRSPTKEEIEVSGKMMQTSNNCQKMEGFL